MTPQKKNNNEKIFHLSSSHKCSNILQEFAISKNIQLGDEKGLKFPSVWDWSLQFTAKDCTLFHNPLYIGKSMPCLQNGSVKAFKRTKVKYKNTPTRETWWLLTPNKVIFLEHRVLRSKSLPLMTLASADFEGSFRFVTEMTMPWLFFLVTETHRAWEAPFLKPIHLPFFLESARS